MSVDSSTVDRIVAGVLRQLGADAVAPPEQSAPLPAPQQSTLSISEHVVTADMLRERLNGATAVIITPRAIVTPSAWDVVKETGIEVRRAGPQNVARQLESGMPGGRSTGRTSGDAQRGSARLLIVVCNTEPLELVWEDLSENKRWSRELLGCPDDAATLAIAELSRGGVSQVVIAAEQIHRAACRANRNEKVNAAAVDDVMAVKSVKAQLPANVWCINPAEKSWFELRNLVKAIGD